MSVQKPPFFHLFMATGFGSGFSPVAPGTAGALLAVLLWIAGYFLLPFGILQTVLAAAIVYFTVQGIYSSAVMEKYWGEDPSRVVIDEMVGVWIPLLVVCRRCFCPFPFFRYSEAPRRTSYGAF